MNNFIYIMGKSSSGKDTIYKKLEKRLKTNRYIMYTTRPIREGEKDGVDYHYVSDEKIKEYEEQGRLIESRTYKTVNGPWTYATVNDNQLSQKGNILTVGTLESYEKIKEYFEKEMDKKLIPIYIQISEDERRKRAYDREARQKKPNYEEVNRRIQADNRDFSDQNLKKCGIDKNNTFENYDLDKCIEEIEIYIKKQVKEEKGFKDRYKCKVEKNKNQFEEKNRQKKESKDIEIE